jgi:hypothetical protein
LDIYKLGKQFEVNYAIPTPKTVWNLRTKENVTQLVFSSKNLFQKPDDGHLMAETCSLLSKEYH